MYERSWLRWPVLCCLLAASPAPRATDDPVATSPGPVLLELFTAQGCSSCPPADEVLSRLGLDEKTRALVVPLAFHVDYWNPVGWVDPFSERAWSLRQDAYGRALKVEGGIYTPQLVVNGQVELNGTDVRRLQAEIEAAIRRASPATIRLELGPPRGRPSALTVTVDVELAPEVDTRKVDMFVALFENNLITRVSNGENKGRTLRNDFIVRRLERAFSMEPGKGGRARREVVLKPASDWRREQLGVAAFLQDPRSMRVLAAAAAYPVMPAAASE